jgi:hypothetical protein
VGAVARNGTKLLGVGFFASLFGVTITNVLVKVPHLLSRHAMVNGHDAPVMRRQVRQTAVSSKLIGRALTHTRSA